MRELDVALTLIGGPTLLIEFGGFRLLTDPTFDAPGTYPGKGITLEKLHGPALTAQDVGDIDAVLLSHDQHWDNLDRSGQEFVEGRTTYTTPAGAARLGGDAIGLAPWQSTTLRVDGDELVITATPARHGPHGIEPISGDVAGFLVGPAARPDLIYVSGDTVWYEGTAAIAERYRPKLTVLFTGAARPRGSFHMTMDANDAIEAANAFREALIVAVHNDGWRHFTETQDELQRSFQTLGLGDRFRPLVAGKREMLRL